MRVDEQFLTTNLLFVTLFTDIEKNKKKNKKMPIHAGSCYCGEIRFTLDDCTKPEAAAYCHCVDCRKAHSSPLYQVVYVPEKSFKITKGKDKVKEFKKKPGDTMVRAFCSCCGSRVFNKYPSFSEARGVFPGLLEDYSKLPKTHRPQVHFLPREGIIDPTCIRDGISQINTPPPAFLRAFSRDLLYVTNKSPVEPILRCFKFLIKASFNIAILFMCYQYLVMRYGIQFL